MGINARYSDARTELTERVTFSREEAERALRNRIRKGDLSVIDYLTKHKGYREEHAQALEPKFRAAICGAEAP